ncbi:hypothetical protein GN956_G13907 [Arapaima gigas]
MLPRLGSAVPQARKRPPQDDDDTTKRLTSPPLQRPDPGTVPPQRARAWDPSGNARGRRARSSLVLVPRVTSGVSACKQVLAGAGSLSLYCEW